jgi:DNA modification methylase
VEKNNLIWHTKKIKLSELKEYAHNPRKISKKAMDKLITSLREDGYHQRMIVNHDHTMIGGHQRKKALLKNGMSLDDELEILIPNRLLTPEELDRINIRDNLAYGEYDFDLLANRFDVETLLNFGMPEDWLKNLGEDQLLASEEKDVGELPANPRSNPGDLYILGHHRLLCGDSTHPSDVSRLLNGATPVLMVTDPPYGVAYDPSWREKADKQIGKRAKGKVLNDDRVDWSEAYALFPGDAAYVWHPSRYTHQFAQSLEQCGFDVVNLIIWSKQHFVISRGDYHHQHEPLWYAVRKGKKHNWQGRRDQSTLWEINNNNAFGTGGKMEEKFGHGTQKPLECMLRPILNNSAKGEGVYDPFCGSGTTLIACEKSDRICYAMELSPAYVDMIVARWEKETRKQAVLENTYTQKGL